MYLNKNKGKKKDRDDWKNNSESLFYSWMKEMERERRRKNTKPERVSGEVKKSLFGFLKRGNKN